MESNSKTGFKMNRIIQLTALSAALAGCGGGDAGFYGPESSGSPPIQTVKQISSNSISLSQTKPNLISGNDSVSMTFRVLDANGGVILGAPLTLSISNPTLSGGSLSTSSLLTTDPVTGLANTDVELSNSNTDYRINHDIKLTASSAQGGVAITREIIIPVRGTRLTLTSNTTTLSPAASATVSATAIDGSGQPLANTKVNLLSTSGIISFALTDSSGIATFTLPAATVSAASGSQLTLTASLEGSVPTVTQASNNSVTLSVPTTNQSLSFLSTTDTTANINTPANVNVQVQAATQAALTGQGVSFATTKGSLSAATASITGITQSSPGVWVGNATTTVQSNSPGNASVKVIFGSTSINTNVKFISTVPDAMTLQSIVSVLGPRGNTSIVAVVEDVNGNAVSNATVSFSIVNDSSGGTLSSPQATTDDSGQASVSYTAGNRATAAGGVIIRASTSSGAVSAPDVTLTVAGQSAYITVAQNNLIIPGAAPYQTFYFKDFADSVLDIAGNPVTNQQVSLVLVPQQFEKGYWSFDTFVLNGATVSKWRQNVTATCTSAQFLNIPNPAAFITSSSASAGANATYVTDNSGAFPYQIRYGKNYATWVDVDLNASTLVGTNRSVSSLALAPLPFPASDLDLSGVVSPPFVKSPYGTNSSCSDLK